MRIMRSQALFIFSVLAGVGVAVAQENINTTTNSNTSAPDVTMTPAGNATNITSPTSASGNGTIAAPSVAPVTPAGTASNITSPTSASENGTVAAPSAALVTPTGTASNITSAPSATPVAPACYTNLTEVYLAVSAKKAYLDATYILCPNTVFNIGYPTSTGECCIDGSRPLVMRGNTKFMCGEDGSSANNCTLLGGQVQLTSNLGTFQFEAKVDMVVQGLTFQNAESAGALLVAPGDITFIDCIFQFHKNTGAITLLFFLSTSRRLAEIAAMTDMNHQLGHTINFFTNLLKDPAALAEYREAVRLEQKEKRQLQPRMDLTRQIATFDSCLFKNNSIGERSVITNYGVISTETDTNDVIVRKSIFENNDFGDKDIVGEGYAIQITQGSTLALSDSCFVNNNFTGSGTIIFPATTNGLTESGNYGTKDDGVMCLFVGIQTSDNATTCIEYSSQTCIAEPTLTAAAAVTSGCSSAQFHGTLTGMVFAFLYLIQ